ncbi:MAG TPA: DUF5605 domain-containing protein [Bacteroidales bacterium]|nr:DUF5605 domain-containing protein [Bacteroidales bacterium]
MKTKFKNTSSKFSLLIIVFLNIILALSATAQKTEQWDIYEINLKGPKIGNPYIDIDLKATFFCEGFETTVNGFYDRNGVYKIRFMPNKTGIWRYTTHSNKPSLNAVTGKFECVKALGTNHGPVRVRNTYHFAYEDGTPYYEIGTTCYAWTHQTSALQEQTLETLKSSPFNKIRMCVFPKDYIYNQNEPEFYVFPRTEDGKNDYSRFNPGYFLNLEKRIRQLQTLGIEADLILFHPYDRWGYAQMDAETDARYLRYIVARLSAFRNVWWSMANEYDLMKSKTMYDWDHLCEVVFKNDPYKHMLGIHNCRGFYNHDKPWITHASIQSTDYKSAKKWREQYKKPLVYDECRYEGNIKPSWGRLTPQQMTAMFWKSLITGTYAGHGETYDRGDEILWWSKGGVLHGESAERIQFFKKYLEDAPIGGYEPINEYAAGKYGERYLYYFDEEKPLEWSFDLPDYRNYQVEIIDTWNMTSEILSKNFQKKFSVKLLGKPYMAVKITCNGLVFPVAPIIVNHDGGLFYKETTIDLSQPDNATIYYTLNDSLPDENSFKYVLPFPIFKNLTLRAVAINSEGSNSDLAEVEFKKVSDIRESEIVGNKLKGIFYQCFKGEWDILPETDVLKPVGAGVANGINLKPKCLEHGFCLVFNGFINVPEDEVYTFYTKSDDGSRLWIGDKLVVDNDGIHGEKEKWGQIALKKGFHPISVRFFDRAGLCSFKVLYRISSGEKMEIPSEMLFHSNK